MIGEIVATWFGIRIERGDSDVRHHDRVDPCSDGLAERRQFDGVKVGAVHIDAGHAQM